MQLDKSIRSMFRWYYRNSDESQTWSTMNGRRGKLLSSKSENLNDNDHAGHIPEVSWSILLRLGDPRMRVYFFDRELKLFELWYTQ